MGKSMGKNIAGIWLFLCWICGGPLHAQLLTPSPVFPADTSTVSIVVDCSRGNQGLLNYANTGDVYVHTGVITSASTSPTDWRYVKFNQNFNQPNPALSATYLGNNRYLFTVPNPRSYYGVPAAEKILRIAILFRNGAGTAVQRNSDASDMYVQVYDGSLAGTFLLPPFQPKYIPAPEPLSLSVGDSITVKFAVDKFASLNLYYNGTLVVSMASADSIQRRIPITASGVQQVVGVADDGVGSVRDTLTFSARAVSATAPLPAGVKDGINYQPGDTSVILVLFAPRKSKVVAVGDFNNWSQQPTYQMFRTPDSNYFWVRIGGLVPGTEYAYQYVIDDTLVVADYNTEKVLDKNVDPSISASTYPNLRSFPPQAVGSLAGIIQTAKPAYAWQVPVFQRPDKKGLVIYELLLRDFLYSSNWQTLTDTLAYLKRLGVNAIEVMPFNNFEGASSWGYNPNFYFAPDKVYGTETALKQFIDACHKQGMAVIMDMVLNHSFGSSPMVRMYYDNTLGVPAADNPWFNQYPTHAYNVGFQFNHESPATKAFTQRVITYWLTNYHIDGYRFDLAKGFTQKRTCDAFGNNCDVGAWTQYDSSRVAIWDTIYNQIQAVSPGSYCILEMFAGNPEQTVEANYGMMLWGNLNDDFNQATMGYGSPSPSGGTWDLSGGLYTTLGWAQPGLVVYQESHDEERLMYKNEQYGNSSGSYNVKNISTGLRRNGMAAAFWSLLPGPKMLWQFGELGYDWSINTCVNGTVDAAGNCRLDPKPSGWPYLLDTSRAKLHDVYAAMLNLRVTYPGLATPKTLNAALTGAFKSLVLSTDGLAVVAVGNFDVVNTAGSVTFPAAGTWYDYFTGKSFPATGNPQPFTLAPGEYHIYTTKPLRDSALSGTGSGPAPSSPAIRIFPNPVAGYSDYHIQYDLPAGGNTSITVLNIMGQRLRSLDLGMQSAGRHTLSPSDLPLSTLSGGYYSLQLVSGGQSTQAKFAVLRK
jgi:1,4-alpha-glucan branching enzyme